MIGVGTGLESSIEVRIRRYKSYRLLPFEGKKRKMTRSLMANSRLRAIRRASNGAPRVPIMLMSSTYIRRKIA